uniref:HMG box domain-containing protein n=1 Tax=Panagrellus redivivus TaxID=6233 RepID=A0A7E4W3C6_PANRE
MYHRQSQGGGGTPHRYQDMQRFKIPDAPMSPYMRFSKKNWNKIRVENGDRPLWEVSKMVAEQWRQLSEAERNEYHLSYEHERVEYEKAMRSINTAPMTQQAAIQQKRQRQGGSRRLDQTSGVIIQPVIDEEPFEMSPKRLAAMRFERNQRLLLELFNGVPMPDVRTFVSPGRIEALRKQSDTLDAHRKRIADEMTRIEESYAARKKTIEQAAENFEAQLKKVSDTRPVVDEEMYAKMVEDAEKKLRTQWERYQQRQEQFKSLQEAERKEAPILYSLTVSPPPASKDESVAPPAAESEAATAKSADPVEESITIAANSNVTGSESMAVDTAAGPSAEAAPSDDAAKPEAPTPMEQ